VFNYQLSEDTVRQIMFLTDFLSNAFLWIIYNLFLTGYGLLRVWNGFDLNYFTSKIGL